MKLQRYVRSIFLSSSILGLFFCLTCKAQNDLLFIHHSVGTNWLAHSLHAELLAKDYIDERNDIYYLTVIANDSGRTDSLGGMPGDNTNMGHWILWFNDYLQHLLTHECANGINRIIMFKSCYPNSNIQSDGTAPGTPIFDEGEQTLANYQAIYRHANGPGGRYTNWTGYVYQPLEDIFAANTNILFVLLTPPPVRSTYPDASAANMARMRTFSTWLTNTWLNSYQSSHPGANNVVVFDLFSLWANPVGHAQANYLRAEYEPVYPYDDTDSHPNDAANAVATPLFSSFLDAAWTAFGHGGSPDGDTTPPGPITGFSATNDGSQVQLAWTNPLDADWSLTVVQRQTSGYASSPTQGSRIYSGRAASYTDSAVTAGQTYYYAAFACDNSNNWTAASSTARDLATISGGSSSNTTTYTFQNNATYSGCRDSFIVSSTSAQYGNNGGSEDLSLYRADGDYEHYRLMLYFDLASVPAGSISSATLDLYLYNVGDSNPMSVGCYPLTRSWTEGTGYDVWASNHVGVSWIEANPSEPWNSPGADYSISPAYARSLPATADSWISFNITSLVDDWINGRRDNYGLIIIPTNGDWTIRDFRSSQFPTETQRPKLTIQCAAQALSFSLISPDISSGMTLNNLNTGTRYIIEGRTNLLYGVSWQTLYSFEATNVSYSWFDAQCTNLPCRYYRFKSQ